MLVLQPFLQSDLGLMMFKPGKTLLSELAKMSQGNRLVVMPLPDDLVNVPSGKLNRPVVPDSSNSLVGDARLLEFFTHPTVRRRLGDFNHWVERIPHCQLSDGEYCDHNLTVMECGHGAVRLCWHHDNQYRDTPNERCIELAERNVMLFSLERVRQQLRLDQGRSVSLQELGWWSILNGVYEHLPDSVITELLGNKRKTNRVTLSPRRESDERFDDNGKAAVDSRIKTISLTIDPEPPAMFMARPKELTWHSEKYLKFVRSLPCVITGKTEGVVAHHLIGHGEGKMGGKTHDLFTMPLAADEHRRFHDDPKGWEARHGSQLFYVKQTIKRALEVGGIT